MDRSIIAMCMCKFHCDAGMHECESCTHVMRCVTQAVQAAQLTFEDYFMADLAVPPLLIVGWEGVFGTAIMVFLMLPIVYFLPGIDGEGLHENSIETLHVRPPPFPNNAFFAHASRTGPPCACCFFL